MTAGGNIKGSAALNVRDGVDKNCLTYHDLKILLYFFFIVYTLWIDNISLDIVYLLCMFLPLFLYLD